MVYLEQNLAGDEWDEATDFDDQSFAHLSGYSICPCDGVGC
ncbi:MAG: hypothetical protein YYHSYBAR_000954 [Candidatus Fervidibacter sacchari]